MCLSQSFLFVIHIGYQCITVYLAICLDKDIFNRPGLAGVVLQTALSLIYKLFHKCLMVCENIYDAATPQQWEMVLLVIK